MGHHPVDPSPTEEPRTAAQPPTVNTAPEPALAAPASAYPDPSGGLAAAEAAAEWHSHAPEAPAAPPGPLATPGGSKELLKLALPLVLSQSFMTIQIAVDRVLLSRHNPDEVAAS